MNLAMMACCSAWVIHSSPFLEYDIFVFVSNAAGVVVQGVALMIRVCIDRKLRALRERDGRVCDREGKGFQENIGNSVTLTSLTPLL